MLARRIDKRVKQHGFISSSSDHLWFYNYLWECLVNNSILHTLGLDSGLVFGLKLPQK